ncbi:carbohydrate kinase, partial [Streptomyces sp. A7024]|nr:carbohydrate kinase [Streptomyces coryli]
MIVVGGEAFIDLVPGGDGPDGLPLLQPARGGGPYNTAVALGRLGASVAYCSRVSTDAFGASLEAGLLDAGVDISLLQRGDEPSTLTVPGLSADGSASYSFYVQGTADRLFALPGALPEGVRALCVGTCSMVLEPGASAYEALLRREAGRGVFTLLDPNIRPGLIPDAEAYRERFRGWLPDVAMLKLSVDDAEWLAPGRDVLGVAKEWLAAGPEVVVLTRGGDGLVAVTSSGGVYEV